MGSSSLTILLLMILFIEGVVSDPRIYSVSPYRFGVGGTRITIIGVGFTEDQFNYFNKSLETRAILTNDVSSQECTVVSYYSNAKKIECETGPRQVMAGSSWYRVHLTADGVEASNSGQIGVQFLSYYTPLITEVSPKTGPPGIVVTLDGNFFTDQYQQLSTFDEEADESSIITGIRMGHRECDMLMEDGVTPYGLSTESLTCKMKGSYVGDYKATVYISGKYGTSQQQPYALKVSASGELFAYQAYPVISDISPTVGSTEGGTLITITGQGFNAQPGKTNITVGGVECEIEKSSSDEVKCRTPVEPASPITEIKGGRGLRYEVWNGNVAADLSDLSALTSSTSGYSYETLDRSEGLIIDGDPAGYTARLSGVFTAPEDAMYEFSLTSQGEAILSISNASIFTEMREIVTLTALGGTKTSDLMHLEKGEHYYMEAVHKGAAANGQVKIGLRRPKTDYTPSDTADSQLEKQSLYVKPREVLHEQIFKILAQENATANFKFVYEGVASESVAFEEGVDKKEEYLEALWDLMTPKCEKTTLGFASFIQDYEDTTYVLPGSSGHFDYYHEAFCGKWSLKNPYRLFWIVDTNLGKDITLTSWFCFAYKGGISMDGRVQVYARYTKTDGTFAYRWFHIMDQTAHSESWVYHCVNLLAEIEAIVTDRLPGSEIMAGEIRVPSKYSGETPIHFDEISLTSGERSVTRIRPAARHSPDIVMREIKLTYIDPVYTLTLRAHNCLGGFTLVGIIGEGENVTDALTSQLSSAETVSLPLESFYVNITRTVTASNPPTGSWSVSYNGSTVSGLAHDINKTEMKKQLETLTGGPNLNLWTWGSCNNRHWTIEFTIGGDQPDFVPDGSGLVFDGITLLVGKWQDRQGGLVQDVLYGDYFNTLESDNWVSVRVNNLEAACLTADNQCQFGYDAGSTPSVSSSSETLNGDGSMSISISGSGFSTTAADNLVKVGEAACVPTSATEASIECDLPAGPAGIFQLKVYSSDGLAVMPSGGITITRPMTILSISPTTGGLGGGLSLVITGSGFPSSLDEWTGNGVTVGGDDCLVTAATASDVTCTTPAKSAPETASVQVTIGGETATSATSFTYALSEGPTVTAFSPTQSLVRGGDTITIDGSEFGSVEGVVKVGEPMCKVTSWNDAQITCILPGNMPGSYPLIVSVKGSGNAYLNTGGSTTITYTLKVTGITPTKGSLLGGTKVIIEGEGFGSDCQQIDIKFGDSLTCKVSECSDTTIKCTTEKLRVTHIVTNNGKHPVYGIGYVWKDKHVVVNQGDFVKWVWASGAEGGSGYSIIQTASAVSNEPLPGGFSSGAERPSGSFLQRMDIVGTFYYSSESELQPEYYMTGIITVNGLISQTLKIHLSVGQYEANHDTSGRSLSASLDEGSCVASDTGITGCSDPFPTDPSDGSFYFRSWQCSTGSVTGMTLLSNQINASAPGQMFGYSGATLSIDGSGFSDQDCQNRVFLEPDILCTTISSSPSNIQCTLSAEMSAFKQYNVITSVYNRGLAESQLGGSIPLTFVLVPEVTIFSPTEGSTAGGFTLTIQGTGFSSQSEAIDVDIGGSTCSVVSVTFTEITCTGGANFPGQMDVLVKFGDTNYARNAASAGQFTYTTNGVAVVDGVFPSTVDNSVSTITINGSSFGKDQNSVKVFLKPPQSRQMREGMPEDASNERRWTYRSPRNPSPFLHFGDQIKKHPIEEWKVADSSFDRRLRNTHPLAKYLHYAEEERSFDEQKDAEIEKVTSCIDPEITPEIMDEETYLEDQCRTIFILKEKSVEGTLLIEERQDDPVEECIIQSFSDTLLTCDVPDLASGQYTVIVNSVLGNAIIQPILSVSLVVASFSPVSGSKYGGTIVTIQGYGFHSDSTVSIGGSPCDVTSVQATEIVCTTTAHAGGTVSVSVTATTGGNTLAGYTYDMAITPTIDSISPLSGDPGTSITLSGSNFDSTGNIVTMDTTDCTVTAENTTSVTFTSPNLAGGTYSVKLLATTGYSNEINFDVPMSVLSMSPDQGSFGGGTLVTITGTGFSISGDVAVTICGEPCLVEDALVSSVKCTVPAATDNGGTMACDVIVSQDSGATDTLSDGWTYDSSLTPTVSSITPTRGGTAGGTTITITGSGFANTGNVVNIDGSACVIQTESNNEIVCETSSHIGSVKAPVTIEVPGKGFADVENVDKFYYIDRWSSIFSWGGGPLPADGEFIVIPEENTILLDIDTAILEFLLLDGGHLIFDDKESSVQLNSKYILIVNGGSLSIGAEGQHYQNNACINLYGSVQDTELPLFGHKVLAVRHGNVDLHGAYIPVTWTHLASTAAAGSTTIDLKQPVTWKPGDEIIIASTDHRHSMGQNEKKMIAAVSSDGYTLTLGTPLEYEHISIEQTFCDRNIETRAEVGLLTRNVKVQGKLNEEFDFEATECEHDFNSGQFKTQTCFFGKFGDETISSMQGATVMMFASQPNQNWVTGRFEYVEVTDAGQAFQLGRYPIHYHLNGDITGNYVRGCAIHKTFNRALTMHAIDGLLVEHNVVYNNMGHAIFTEDGIEKNNIIQYNLAVYTRGSSSLLNVDVTPASYWLVNPLNIVRHNAAAGSTHFGYWYRVQNHPEGPSFTNNYCPNKVPFGEFYNNTAHTLGWYGLWVFSMAGYWPQDNDGFDNTCGNNAPTIATFKDFLAWRCERGAEFMFGWNMRLVNFIGTDNEKAGVEFMLMNGPRGQEGPGIADSCIVGYSQITGPDECCQRGLVTPKMYRISVDNVTFVNFDVDTCSAMGACSQCRDRQGGFEALFSGLTFDNAPNKVTWKWTHETQFRDLDGSLTGKVGATALPQTDAMPPSKCTFNVTGFSGSQVLGAVCEASVDFHRIAWNEVTPHGLWYKDVALTSQYGSAMVPFREKRLTHKNGWMALIHDEEEYEMSYINAEHLTNISYKGTLDRMEPGDYLYMSHNLTGLPDVIVTQNGEIDPTDGLPDPDTDFHGDWTFNNDTKMLTYMASANERSLRGPTVTNYYAELERHINFQTIKCFFTGCIAPTLPPNPEGTPDSAVRWSEDSSWDDAPPGFGGHGGVQPVAGSDILIPEGQWMLADVVLPKLDKVYIYGVLQIEDKRNNVLEANLIIIRGGKLIAGFPESDTGAATPFTHDFSIILQGAKGSPETFLEGTPPIGAKAMGVFGALLLIGKDYGVTWTKLAATVEASSNSITVEDDVDWETGQSIVITTTNFDSDENEVHVISSVSVDKRTIMLETPLVYKHLSESGASSDGHVSYSMKADVGLLTRNIKIEAGNYPKSREESYGARVLVSRMIDNGKPYKGRAQLENVEFYHAGQDGYTDSYDPRFSLSFLNTGPSTAAERSFVKKCAFNVNFNTAIGLFGTANIEVEDNVVYHTVTAGITDTGTSNVWKHNLVTSVLFPGTYDGRLEPQNQRWDCGFNVAGAVTPSLTDNVVAGSERCGFRISGDPCGSDVHMSNNNEAHGVLHGIFMLDSDGISPCTRISNFYIWKAHDFGIYFHIIPSVVIENMVIADSYVGILPMLYAPGALSHVYEKKFIHVKNNILIGRSDTYECDNSMAPKIVNFRQELMPPRTLTGGMTGVRFASFSSSMTMALSHGPFDDPGSYPALGGGMSVTNNIFAQYDIKCGSQEDFAITSNEFSDDAQHPMVLSGNVFIDVPNENRVFFFRARLARINPSDCVDLACDGANKLLMIDEDGSILGDGTPATVISQSEYEWGGDPRRGLGYYRVPISLYTAPDGSKIDYETITPNTGIYRGDGDCQYMSSWQAYHCTNISHRMLILESMDKDTEVRRLSPIAVASNLGPNGSVDVVNGPQDRGWCFGYTCQERISTFYIIVALDVEHVISLTSTPPGRMRLRLLDVEENDEVIVKIWFRKSQRYVIYVDKITKVYPNDYSVDNNGKVVYRTPVDFENPVEFIPTLGSSQIPGENYFDRYSKLLTIRMRGPKPIDIVTVPTVTLNIGISVNINAFFEDNVIRNLAGLLNIEESRIRIMNVIRESRLLRTEDNNNKTDIDLEIEVSPPTLPENLPTNQNDAEKQVAEAYQEAIDTIATAAYALQTGEIDAELGYEVKSLSIIEPLPPPNDPPPKATEETGGDASQTGKTFSEKGQEADLAALEAILVPEEFDLTGGMEMFEQPSGDIKDRIPFPNQPHVFIADVNGSVLTSIGTNLVPWEIEVKLLGGPRGAKLLGTTSMNVVNGWCNFTNLALSPPGRSYSLKFEVKSPDSAGYVAQSKTISVKGIKLSLKLNQPTIALKNKAFDPPVSVTLMNKETKKKVEANLQPYNWKCTMFPTEPGKKPILGGTLRGKNSVVIRSGSNSAVMDGLSIDKHGHMYTFKMKCKAIETSPKDLVLNFRPISVLVKEESSITKRFSATITASKIPTKEKKRAELCIKVINALDPVPVGAAWTCIKTNKGKKKMDIKGTIQGKLYSVRKSYDRAAKKTGKTLLKLKNATVKLKSITNE